MKQVCKWENYDQQTATCSAPEWVPDSGSALLPSLSIPDALLLGGAVWGVLALAWGWRFIRNSI